MPCWRGSHYALIKFRQCLPHPCTFVVGSHYVFVTSRDLSINTRFNFSETHFCFNNDTVKMNSVQNSELLLPLKCLLQGQQALFDKQVALLMVRRRRHIRNRRRCRSCWVRPWLSEERRLQFGHYDRLLAELRMGDQQSFFNFLRMPQDALLIVHGLFSEAMFTH